MTTATPITATGATSATTSGTSTTGAVNTKSSCGPASAAVALLCAALFWLSIRDADSYYQLLQEDGVLEWTTVFALLLAAGCFARAALRGARGGLRAAWFPALLSIFCAFVALEEISWGQRLIGYRPPAYFLEHNFQQELNVHNVASSFLRELVLIAVLGVWGSALPLALRTPRASALAQRVGLVTPPLAQAPFFAFSLALYLVYPLPFTGEITELLLGIGLLLVGAGGSALGWWGAAAHSGAALGSAVFLALATVAWWTSRPADPARIAQAGLETEALTADLGEIARRRGAAPTGCGLHKRLYTFVTEYEVAELEALGFAALAKQGTDPERIRYFLDPWNSPYWVRDECEPLDGERSTFVYSFGPDRRRDSSEWELGGDDIGAYLVSPAARAPARGSPPP
jgi:hypothetical protein